MAFCTRVFCQDEPGPTISDVLMWLRQHDTPVMIVGGESATDLVNPWWTEVQLAYQPDEPPLAIRCHRRSDPTGSPRLDDELRDFNDDLAELPESPEREHILRHLAMTVFVVVVEFPTQGVIPRAYETNGWLMSVFVERAGGMVQCDGIGFYDGDDEVTLRLG